MTNVLVTGGAGYIGSHVCKELKRNGYTPVAYDSLEFGFEKLVKWGPLEVGDINDSKRLAEVFEAYQFEGVIDMAAYISVAESTKLPSKYYRNNVAGLLTILDTMLSHGCMDIIFSSSAAVYGIPDTAAVNEEAKKQPINPYGASKLYGEQFLETLHKEAGLRYVALRYFNACGADVGLETGDEKTDPTNLIPRVIQAVLQDETVEVYGTDYETSDGSAIRDYIHVTDLATAHVKALQYLKEHRGGYAFNLGTGKGSTVLEVIKMVEEVSHKKVKVRMADRRAGDPPELVSDAMLAHDQLGWTPSYSDLHTIVKSAYDWKANERK